MKGMKCAKARLCAGAKAAGESGNNGAIELGSASQFAAGAPNPQPGSVFIH